MTKTHHHTRLIIQIILFWIVGFRLGAAIYVAFDVVPKEAMTNMMAPAEVEASKFSRDLQAAVKAKGKYEGMTRKGRPVIQYADTFSRGQMFARMATVQEISSPVTIDSSQFDPINELVVYGTDRGIFVKKELAGLNVSRSYEAGGYVVVQSGGGFSAEQLQKLEADGEVKYAEPNYQYHLADAVLPDDPAYTNGTLWGLENIHAAAAWQTVRQSPIIVAVIDTGVDYDHADLRANMWVNPGETGTDSNGAQRETNGVDDDADGFVDDVYGADFYNHDGDPKGGSSHGTHCAGIIGAVGNNETGVVGVAWGVQIMAVQIFNDAGDSSADADVIAQAIDFAVKKGAKVINASWGAPNAASLPIQNAIANAQTAGVLFVAAAGNSSIDTDVPNQRFYPAGYTNDNIIAVSSIDTNDALSYFSNFGKSSVAVAAPGSHIYSTMPGGLYDFKDGTSMAAPFVAGAAALIWAAPGYQNAPAWKIKQAILDHARKLSTLADRCVCGGTLDLSFLGGASVALTPHLPETAAITTLSSTNIAIMPAVISANTNETRIFKGKLRFPAFAIGAESTGFEMKTETGVFQLDPQNSENIKTQLKALNGKNVIVSGKLIIREGIETGKHALIEVNEVKVEK